MSLTIVQERLRAAGFDPGPIDGIWGPRLSAALDAALAAARRAAGPLGEPERFARCLAEVLNFEGGFVDDRRDHGGATNRGITLATLRDWRAPAEVTKADVRALGLEETAAIYRANYWKACGADAAPAGLDLMLFDCAVNQGVGRAVRWAQGAVRVPADGIAGPHTRAALAAADPAAVAEAVADLREAHYRSLPNFETYGRGWLRRLNHVRALARAWA